MDAREIWDLLCSKNEKLQNPDAEVTIKARELRKIVDFAHKKGVETSDRAAALLSRIIR